MNNILLICGGNSVEHEISVITALQLINKYKGKYKLHLCYLKNGEFYYVKKHNDYSFYNKTSKLHKINFKANKHFVTVGFKKICFDGILLGVHGINCEDGTLYSYFKTLNINVINENIYSASVGQDKVFSKKLSEVNYIPYLYVDRWLFAKDKKKILNFLVLCSLTFW